MINNKVYGLLGLATKAGKLSFGTESCLETIIKKKAKLVIVTEDAAERTINNFEEKCKQNNIDFYVFGKKEDLSKSIGKVNKTVISIKDKNLAGAVKKILNGGDVIG
ncbi:MAG: 50S ribosomal protein L7ae [Clostridiales bacterium]|nr:50S ribosomal protein L7ae [Clostridiales bacterium]